MANDYSDSPFALEGGKYFLAEALFREFKFKIRCPQCEGNPLRQGFIADQAGSGTLAKPYRRHFTCQRSAAAK
jgi:hypothetical protein